jgi:hypothetical protein
MNNSGAVLTGETECDAMTSVPAETRVPEGCAKTTLAEGTQDSSDPFTEARTTTKRR